MDDAKKFANKVKSTEKERPEMLNAADRIEKNSYSDDINIYTSKDVLAGYLDFITNSASKNMWSESELKENPHRLNKLKSLKSLFKTFNLGDIERFESGNFVRRRKISDYEKLFDMIKSDPVSKNIKYRQIFFNYAALSEAFHILIEYRATLEKALRCNRGTMTASGICAFACLKAEHINSTINKNLSSIDEILCLIISPSHKAVSKKDLIDKFDYPEDALGESDKEWF